MFYYTGIFSGIRLYFAFTDNNTALYYGKYLTACECSDECIQIPTADIVQWMARWNCHDFSYAEYVISCSYACDALMRKDRLLFHGASFLWNNRIYIFTGPSGIGKTTQLKLWQALYGRECSIQNGDKPIIELCSNEELLVHSSPWKGKEGYGRDDIIAPLGGIILLKQEKDNSIEKLKPDYAARVLFGRIYSTFTTEDDVLVAGKLLERVILKTPVWLLSNRGDKESAQLTHRTLLREDCL